MTEIEDSGSAESNVNQRKYQMLSEITAEPMYISEIWRKLNEHTSLDWTLKGVASRLGVLSEKENFELVEVGYNEGGGQWESSPLQSMTGEKLTKWNQYIVVYNKGMLESNIKTDSIRKVIDSSVDISDKVDEVFKISNIGNIMAQKSEVIAQDVFERQFRYYDEVVTSDYDSPGLDLYVRDEKQRDFGLAIEVSTRWVNPIGNPYIDNKKDKAFDKDLDLVILAPKFRSTVIGTYEAMDTHDKPGTDMLDLHEVPKGSGHVYDTFLEELSMMPHGGDGNLIIISDNERTMQMLSNGGHVGSEYPVVSDDYSNFAELLSKVNRDYTVITESRYRNQLRESVEPLFWEFLRPYKIEQFLIDMYWDRGLTQSNIGRLVDRSGSTIGDWMRSGKWDVIRRGTGAPELSEGVFEIWERMYKGKEPFPKPFSGYRIQAEYNRHPLWTLDDWRDFYNDTTESERVDMLKKVDSYREDIDYTVMMGVEDRLQPSYSFIINTLKNPPEHLDVEPVEVREPDRAPKVPYNAYSNSKTVEYMINRGSDRIVAEDDKGGQRMREHDVEVFDSYLEVDVADWLSENEIPYAHEPFTIPSVAQEGSGNYWDKMVNALQALGDRRFDDFDSLKEGTPFSDMRAAEVLAMWEDIYDKHRLQDEQISIPVRDTLQGFRKQYVLPDLVLYEDAGTTEVPMDWDGWDSWSAILEVSGLWGVGLPDEVTEDEWWDWYRVAGVAFKELAYKMLGLWEDVYFLVPFQPYIEGVSDGIPVGLRDDDHYTIFNTTSADIQLEELADELGVYTEAVDSGLSPEIEPIRYLRGVDEGVIETVEYTYEGLNMDNIGEEENVFPVSEDMVVYAGDLGELYISDSGVFVRESLWMSENMIMLRQYVVDSLSKLSDSGVIEGLERV